MFAEMKVLYYTQRSLAQLASDGGKAMRPAAVTARDLLEFATIRGAECNALERKCGSLTVGKEADVVLLRLGDLRIDGANNAIGAVVHYGSVDRVDSVFVAGQVRKWRGELVGPDRARIHTSFMAANPRPPRPGRSPRSVSGRTIHQRGVDVELLVLECRRTGG